MDIIVKVFEEGCFVGWCLVEFWCVVVVINVGRFLFVWVECVDFVVGYDGLYVIMFIGKKYCEKC